MEGYSVLRLKNISGRESCWRVPQQSDIVVHIILQIKGRIDKDEIHIKNKFVCLIESKIK